jgi:hypothetical protein
METRSIPIGVLLAETIRRLPKYLLLAAVLGLGYIIAYYLLDTIEPVPAIGATFFTLVYFSAPMVSSSVRVGRGLRPFDAAGRTVLVFCFIWGAIVVALFIVSLQLWQGMEATVSNYFCAMVAAGLGCAAVGLIPSGGDLPPNIRTHG